MCHLVPTRHGHYSIVERKILVKFLVTVFFPYFCRFPLDDGLGRDLYTGPHMHRSNRRGAGFLRNKLYVILSRSWREVVCMVQQLA